MVPDNEKWLHQYLKNLEDDIKEIKSCLTLLKNSIDERYLTKAEFKANFSPIKLLVYGVVATILGWAASKIGMVMK